MEERDEDALREIREIREILTCAIFLLESRPADIKTLRMVKELLRLCDERFSKSKSQACLGQ